MKGFHFQLTLCIFLLSNDGVNAMLKKYISFLFITVLILSFGCSSSDKSINEEETNDEVYVFDEVPVD